MYSLPFYTKQFSKIIFLRSLILIGLLVSCSAVTNRQLKEQMKQFVDKPTALPGMIGAVLDSTGIRMIQAVGERKAATTIPLLPTDRVHIGSCTKAFTAVVIARLIDEKLLDWDSTLATIFPEFQSTIHPDYLEVTVKTLFTHRAGLPRNPTEKDLARHLRLPIVQARKAIVKASLSEAPKNTKECFCIPTWGIYSWVVWPKK